MGVAEGKAKYTRKMQTAVAKYNAKKGQMAENWAAGLARAGVTPGPVHRAAYQAGIAAANFRGGDPDKWESNFRAGISR